MFFFPIRDSAQEKNVVLSADIDSCSNLETLNIFKRLFYQKDMIHIYTI